MIEPSHSDRDRRRLACAIFEPRASTSRTLLETIGLIRREARVPLIGFAGAPFTLASYLIEGSGNRDVRRNQADATRAPAVWTACFARPR